jgi:hypothetical protein
MLQFYRHTCCNTARGLPRFGESAVPIYDILRRQGVFAPDEVAMLGNVFEDVLQTLGLMDRQESTNPSL